MKTLFCILLITSFCLAKDTLVFSGVIKDGQDNVTGMRIPNFVTISPDNKNAYVTSAADDALVVFNRDISTGALAFSACFRDSQGGVDGLNSANSVALSPDNKNVYVTASLDKTLAVFNRDVSTGALTYSTCFKDGENGVDGLSGARSVFVSPDNKNVFTAGVTDKALAVFNRDVATGALTYSTCFKDGEGGVDGLRNARSVAVSPDNKNVYVVGENDSALAVFNRDTSTGALIYSTYFKDGKGGVDGLYIPFSVTVSPDNKNVYVIGYGDNALAVFNRDTATGALTYSTCLIDEQGGVEGLSYAYSMAVSPDNQKVYTISQGDSALAVFDRNVGTGALTYSTCFIDSKNGVTGLKGPVSVTVSPDNKNIYVAGSQDNAIAIFKVVHTVPISAPSDIPIKQQTYFSASSKGRFYTIVFDAKASGNIILSLLNAQGKLVKKVMSNSMTAGNHIVKADFSDVQSGIYFLSLANGIKTQAIKIVIAKQE